MSKAEKVKIGHVMCLTPGCNTKVPVRQNTATGALSFPCIECGAPSYAKKDGSEHYANVMARMIPLDTSQDVPKDPTNPPAKPPQRTIFG